MKPVQERLHIDELKRVEKQTNILLKAWRALNKAHRQLQDDYDKLNIRHNLVVQEHQDTLARRAEEYRVALENADARWRSRYDEDKAAWAAEKEALITANAQALQAQAEENQRSYDALQAELDQANQRKQAMIDRIRGVGEV
ncbi:MAG: hypothetical protein Q4A74_02120 [Cardiobacteriaceae bacterium]|nr:hypothetical protein [Cardiobacteriaceae bacterium]